MPISPSASTGVKGSTASLSGIDSGSGTNYASASLTVPTSGELVTVVTAAWRWQSSAGNLINDVTLAGSSMTLAKRKNLQVSTTMGAEVCIWYAMNVSSGAKTVALDFVNEDDSTVCNWHADSWAGIVTSSALDVTSDNSVEGSTTSFAVPNSGTTGTLAQASELVIAVASSKWNWTWNGTYGGGGSPPSGYTLLAGLTEDNSNTAIFQTAYKEVSSTTGVSCTWTKEDTGYNVGALATFKIGTVSKRIKVLSSTSMNSATGITAYAWAGDPAGEYAQKWTGLSAESSGGTLYITTGIPSSWTTGSTVNVILYQSSGDKKGTSFVTGKVEEV
jgi:hypothetical protein